MTDNEHSINREHSDRPTSDDDDGSDEPADQEEERSEAEIKRELRESVVGRAIIKQAERQRRR